jgi:hypothetical protein
MLPDEPMANILIEGPDQAMVAVYRIQEDATDITPVASFRKPQGPVSQWQIGAGAAYSIPVCAISGNYLLWNETMDSKEWKTLAHTEESLSYLAVHTLPDGLAGRQYLKGKFWAEYFDYDGFHVVPVASKMRAEANTAE